MIITKPLLMIITKPLLMIITKPLLDDYYQAFIG